MSNKKRNVVVYELKGINKELKRINEVIDSTNLKRVMDRISELTAMVSGTKIGVENNKFKTRIRQPTFASGKNISDDTVREIRRKYSEGIKQVQLSNEYGYSPSIIHGIVKNKTYKDVE
jgi:hypothetical protein